MQHILSNFFSPSPFLSKNLSQVFQKEFIESLFCSSKHHYFLSCAIQNGHKKVGRNKKETHTIDANKSSREGNYSHAGNLLLGRAGYFLIFQCLI